VRQHMELKKYALRQSRDGYIISFVVHPSDIDQDLMGAKIGTVYYAKLVEADEQGGYVAPTDSTNP
jgi:hypothetical protein